MLFTLLLTVPKNKYLFLLVTLAYGEKIVTLFFFLILFSILIIYFISYFSKFKILTYEKVIIFVNKLKERVT